MFILLLATVALAVLKVMGKIDLPWMVIGLVAAAYLLWPVIQRLVDSLANAGTQFSDPKTANACGCSDTQKVLVREKRWPAKDTILTTSCSNAMNLITRRPNKYSIKGCSMY
jgi:hypothetical protein